MTGFSALFLVLGAVAVLLTLVLVVRLHAFLALLITTLGVGLIAGLPADRVIQELQSAVGGTLGTIAVVIGLGALFGEMLAASGGAERLAQVLMRRFGTERAPTALGLSGLLVAIPVFFDVAFILFVPIFRQLARRTGKRLMVFAAPLLVALATAHAFIPPTPGPVAVAGLLGADLGWVLLFGLICGTVSWFVVGTQLAPRIGALVPSDLDAELHREYAANGGDEGSAAGEPPLEISGESGPIPSFRLAFSLVLLPLLLILCGTVGAQTLTEGALPARIASFVGHPFVALLAATLAAHVLLRSMLPQDTAARTRLFARALEPVGSILLVTAAGGALGKMLLASGVGDALSTALTDTRFPVLLLAFAIALVLRIAQGSATVAMVTSAGLLQPLLAPEAISDPALLAALTVAIASGATACSHLNDSGFWLVSRYLGLDTARALRSWTLLTALIGLAGLASATVVLAIARVLGF